MPKNFVSENYGFDLRGTSYTYWLRKNKVDIAIIQIHNNVINGVFCDSPLEKIHTDLIREWAKHKKFKCSDNLCVLGSLTTQYKKEVY